VFDGVLGSTFTLTATPTVGNPAGAPINAVEIVMTHQIPEPPSFVLIAFGAIAAAIAIWHRWVVACPRG
jgi:hypothetical protein